MARNTNAGKFTGKSKSSIFYANNPKARAVKEKLNTKIGKTPEAIKKRGEDNKARKALGLKKGDNRDASAKMVDGKVKYVAENRSVNRGGTGKDYDAMPGDKRARPGKKLYKRSLKSK
mgnify:CR=1 FL=1